MRRRTAFLGAVAAVLGILTIPGGRAEPVSSAPWIGEPPLVAGTSRYDGGEWIYNDFVFDDYGADTGSWGQPNVVSLAPTSGDARYPVGDEFAGNAADIVEVRVRAAGDVLELRVTLQTLIEESVPAIWVKSGDFERVFTSKNARVDLQANVIDFSISGVAGGPSVDLSVAAGLNDGAGGLRAGVPGNEGMSPSEYTTGAPTDNRLFDVAFNSRTDEPRGGAWNEDAQSDALNAADLSAFVEAVDLTSLRNRVRTELRFEPGYYVRLFRSRQNITEGMKEEFPQYGGSLQPYALWIPDSFDPGQPTRLFLNMHSLSVHHNQYRGGTSPTYRTYYEQMGDALDAIVVTPLGRGPDGWYLDEAFIDTLEVWADALATFPTIDRDRMLVSGYSMGGYGTYRLATLMPDSFASAVSIVGPPNNGIWTGLDMPSDEPYFTYPQLENTRNVPFWITHGVLDELVPVVGVTRQAQRLGELGHEYRFAVHPVEDHLTFAAKDDWSRETAWLASHSIRVSNPSEVTLRVRPASLLSEEKRQALAPLLTELLGRVGARTDGAYWVRHVVVAGAEDADVTGVVNLTSDGIARQRTAVTGVQSPGVDGPSPHLLTGNDVTYGDVRPQARLSGTVRNVTALTIDLTAAGFDTIPVLDIDSDQPVAITFVRGTTVVGGMTAPASDPAAGQPATRGGSISSLPATGPRNPVALGAGALAVALLLRLHGRRRSRTT